MDLTATSPYTFQTKNIFQYIFFSICWVLLWQSDIMEKWHLQVSSQLVGEKNSIYSIYIFKGWNYDN